MSEGGMTLSQVAQRLDSYDDELMIWARARIDLADLTPDTEAVVAPELEDVGVWWEERGVSYVPEVDLAKEATEVWRQWRDSAEPSAAQRRAAVIHCAVNDAFLEVGSDEPAAGPEDRSSRTSEDPPAQ